MFDVSPPYHVTTTTIPGVAGILTEEYVEMRDPHTGKLLFKLDPNRWLIEIQCRGIKTLIDLTQYLNPKTNT